MKRLIPFLFLFLLGMAEPRSQVLIAHWTFPTGTPADSLADGGLPVNLTKAIHTEGGTSAIDFSKNGYTTKAAQATGWDGGANGKCWVVEITTTEYAELTISSKQQSGGTNPGPRDWKVQYRIGSAGSWTDVPNTLLNVQNDWTSGVLGSVPLPEECKNQPSLFIRWIMTTDTSSVGGLVTSNGISKIDDIVITGKLINTAVFDPDQAMHLVVYPNPCTRFVTVFSDETILGLSMTDVTGREVLASEDPCRKLTWEVSGLPSGYYLIRVKTDSMKRKVIRILKCD